MSWRACTSCGAGGGASRGPKAPSGPELKRRMQAAKKEIKEKHPSLRRKVDTALQRRGEGKHKFEERVLLAEQQIERAKVAHAEREAREAAARACIGSGRAAGRPARHVQ